MFAPVKRTRVNPAVLIALGAVLLIGAPAALLILRSGDDGAATRVGSAALPAGWTAHEVAADGFRLGLPPQWQKVAPGEVGASLETLRKDNPELAEMIEGQVAGSLNELVRFFAFDTRSPTLAQEFATNINVVVEPLPSGTDFERYLEANLSQLRRVPTVTVSLDDDDLALPGGRAAAHQFFVHLELAERRPGDRRAAVSLPERCPRVHPVDDHHARARSDLQAAVGTDREEPSSRSRRSAVPGEGLEPSRPCSQWILSPSRIPFRHPGAGSEYSH